MRALIILLCLALGWTMAADELKEVPQEPLQHLYGGRIQRFMGLLEMSNELHGMPVRVLVYGQSIMAQGAANRALKELRSKYPHADLQITNRAIGGCTAPSLVHAAVTDLYPFYPDLLVFHVYSGEKRAEFERIISNVRRYTTAEIMLLTHHMDHYGPERDKARDDASSWRRGIAQKYNCELVDTRPVWKAYLKQHSLEAKDLLRDNIHLNPHGLALQSELIGRHFQVNALFPNNWLETVKSYEVARPEYERENDLTFKAAPWKPWTENNDPSSEKGNSLKLEFVGNRIDVRTVQVKGKLGTATILIDGKKPSAFPETFACTRVNAGPRIWFPGIYCVRPGKNPIAEEWVMKITELEAKGRSAPFTVTGSVTGKDGSGTLRDDFTSNSGRIEFSAGHLTLFSGPPTKKPMPENYELRWKVYQMGVDVWEPTMPKDGKSIGQFTLVQGLSNTKHTLEIIPNGDGRLPLKEILVHSPPLK